MSGLPSHKHYGVGFFASPSLRPRVKDIKPHSPRICELTIDTSPHLDAIDSIYAYIHVYIYMYIYIYICIYIYMCSEYGRRP